MFQDELLDIVDVQDQVIGTMLRSQVYEKKMFKSIRSSWLMIKNQDGKLWIPRRSSRKKVLPNFLDGSVVGHVSSGETYEQTLIRETQEEINLDITNLPYKKLGKLNPNKDNSFCFSMVYELQVHNSFSLNYNKDDFSEFFWLSPKEIFQKIKQGEKVKDTVQVVLQKFYED